MELAPVPLKHPRCMKMEPGGIEPPSRDSQHVASTRVSDVLISIRRTTISSIPPDPAPGVFSLRRPFAPRLSQPDVLWSTAYRALAMNHATCFIRLRDDNRCCWQLLMCVIFTRPSRPSTRHDKSSLPGRIQIGPSLSKNVVTKTEWIIARKNRLGRFGGQIDSLDIRFDRGPLPPTEPELGKRRAYGG